MKQANLALRLIFLILFTQSALGQKFEFKNSHDSRYFFSSSSNSLAKGEMLYQNFMISSSFLHYGFSDNFTLGAGFELISTLTWNPVWFLFPKVSYEINADFNFSAEVQVYNYGNNLAVSLALASITYGNSNSNLTFTTGYGGTRFDYKINNTFILAGLHRLSNHIALISENIYLTNKKDAKVYLGIHGFRFLWESASLDISSILLPEDDGTYITGLIAGFTVSL